jgi:hypothetical protein
MGPGTRFGLLGERAGLQKSRSALPGAVAAFVVCTIPVAHLRADPALQGTDSEELRYAILARQVSIWGSSTIPAAVRGREARTSTIGRPRRLTITANVNLNLSKRQKD